MKRRIGDQPQGGAPYPYDGFGGQINYTVADQLNQGQSQYYPNQANPVNRNMGQAGFNAAGREPGLGDVVARMQNERYQQPQYQAPYQGAPAPGNYAPQGSYQAPQGYPNYDHNDTGKRPNKHRTVALIGGVTIAFAVAAGAVIGVASGDKKSPGNAENAIGGGNVSTSEVVFNEDCDNKSDLQGEYRGGGYSIEETLFGTDEFPGSNIKDVDGRTDVTQYSDEQLSKVYASYDAAVAAIPAEAGYDPANSSNGIGALRFNVYGNPSTDTGAETTDGKLDSNLNICVSATPIIRDY